MASPPTRRLGAAACLRARLAVAIVAAGLAVGGAVVWPGAAGAAEPLGTVSPVDGPPDCPAGADCPALEVTCPGLSETRVAELSVVEPVGAPRGVVVFFSGARGLNWYLAPAETADLGASLRGEGFTVVQVRWDEGWSDAAQDERAGLIALACRPATVLDWVYANVYLPLAVDAPATGVCGFCVTGASGGASQIGYGLGYYGLDDIIDVAVMTGGPPHADMAKGCLGLPGYAYSGEAPLNIDGTYGFLTGGGPCEVGDESWQDEWDAESLALTAGDYDHPGTRIHFIMGSQDSTAGPAMAADYRDRLVDASSATIPFEVLAGVGHSVQAEPAGRAALAGAILAGVDDDPPPTTTTTSTSTTTPSGGPDGPPTVEGPQAPQVHRSEGGGSVRIYGTGFVGTTSVTIGGVEVPDFEVVDGNLIIATVPAGPAGYAHVEVTDDEGIATSDLDGDGEVDDPNSDGVVAEADLERGAILYSDADLAVPAAALGDGELAEVSVAGYQPNEDVALAQVNPLGDFLEQPPADPDDFPPGSPYADALTFTGTDDAGDNVPTDVTVRSGASFNADDVPDYDAAATCPVTQPTADYGLDRCSIAASQLGMGRLSRQVSLTGDPAPAGPDLALVDAPAVGDGDTVTIGGTGWHGAPHFGSATDPDPDTDTDPWETDLTIEICDAALTTCTPAERADAEVDVVRYRDTAGGLPVEGELSGAELSGSFVVAGADACQTGCVVRVRQQRYDINANAPVEGDFVEATVPLVATAASLGAAVSSPTGLRVEVGVDPASRPEPGGEFTFIVEVANTGAGPLVVTGVTDEAGASLDGRGTCRLEGTELAAGESTTCSFEDALTSRSGGALGHVVTVTAEDDGGGTLRASARATAEVTPAPEPSVAVTAAADPPALDGPGPFTVTVEVVNDGEGALTIAALDDVVYDPLTGQGSCEDAVGTELAPGGRYTCAFEGEIAGGPGDTQTDTVTVTATDAAGNKATDRDELTVTIDG